MLGYGRPTPGEISDARPAQPHNHSMPYLYLFTSAPADQQATVFFFLSRAFQPMRLPAAVWSSTASYAPEEAVAGSSAVRSAREAVGAGSSAASSTPEEAAAGSSAASHAPRLQGWSSPRRSSRCPGRRGGAPRRAAASQADGSSSMGKEKREATTTTSTARTRERPRFGPRGSRPGRNMA
jgi:hypothetical protein